MEGGQQSCEQQPSTEPQLCRKNCGFFGNPATLGLCSKCYRESQQDSTKNVSSKKAEVIVEPVSASLVSSDGVPKSSEVSPPTVGGGTEPADQTAKPEQKNKNRCFSCNKKVGLLGFECRCGYVYCSGHRHAADHDCSFDYAAFDRERLAKANPTVAASKIDKL